MTELDQENHNQTVRLCDFCNESKALLYCRADSAKLCLTCDREVHSTNQLFKKHNRSLLCNSCNSSPASIFCCTDSSVLCQNCDWEIHNNFRSVHDRRPIEGFNGCPSVSELLNILGLDDFGKKNLSFDGENDEGFLDMLVWETPSVVSLDDLIVSNDSGGGGRSFQAMGVPPLPKNRKASCGKHKDEILCQLREMAKTEPNFSASLDQAQVPPLTDINNQGSENHPDPMSVPTYETNANKWCDFTGGAQDEDFLSTFAGSFIETSHLVPDKDSDIGESTCNGNGFQGVVPEDSKKIQMLPKAGLRELNSQERDSALSRYKQKKKTRRYEKHIRYESRKVRAESRIRIKGRFAKMDR